MQGGSTGIVYGGLKYQARCIADVSADPDNTSFLAGTLSLKEENEVHLIRLSPYGTELVCEGLFYHPSEIWDLKSCPFDSRIFSTVYTSGETYGASIWMIPDIYGQSNAPQLEELVSLKEYAAKLKCVLWWPRGRHDKVVSIDEGNLFLWSIDSSSKIAKMISQESVGMLHRLSGGSWDPHDRNVVATICESSLQCWDLRTMNEQTNRVFQPSLTVARTATVRERIRCAGFRNFFVRCMKTSSIENAHFRDVDYNPKKQHIIVTAEDESGIRIWDLRKPKFPMAELPGHVHWTWTVRYNPEYDDLILTAGTDSAVNLLSASTIGSNDSTPESLADYAALRVDPLLHSYSDYEDSVYGVAWSCREPSIFASLSYDGRVVVESVKPYLHKN